MAWRNMTRYRRFVDYWLILEKTDLVTDETTVEYYKHSSKDVDPNLFVDNNNDNEVNAEYWTAVTEDDIAEAEPETMRSVEYTPTSETDEDQVRTLWIYQYSFRNERIVVKEREKNLCIHCEHYVPSDGDELENPVWCDFRNGLTYYCHGYADLITCRNCAIKKSGARGRCDFHCHIDGVTGRKIYGNCDEWNHSGECRGFAEKFEDECL